MKRAPTWENEVKNPATRCRALRKKKGLSQDGLAYEVGVSSPTISRMEQTEKGQPLCMRVGNLMDVAKFLGVSPLHLYPALGEKPKAKKAPVKKKAEAKANSKAKAKTNGKA